MAVIRHLQGSFCSRAPPVFERLVAISKGEVEYWAGVGLYTILILPLPIVCGIYCNNEVSVGNITLRNIVGDAEVG